MVSRQDLLDIFQLGLALLVVLAIVFLFGACGSAPPPDSRRCGYWNSKTREIAVVLSKKCGSPENIIAHEIGHAFGLQHSKDENSIMYESTHMEWTVEHAAASLVYELQEAGRGKASLSFLPSPALFQATEHAAAVINAEASAVAGLTRTPVRLGVGGTIYIIEDTGSEFAE